MTAMRDGGDDVLGSARERAGRWEEDGEDEQMGWIGTALASYSRKMGSECASWRGWTASLASRRWQSSVGVELLLLAEEEERKSK